MKTNFIVDIVPIQVCEQRKKRCSVEAVQLSLSIFKCVCSSMCIKNLFGLIFYCSDVQKIHPNVLFLKIAYDLSSCIHVSLCEQFLQFLEEIFAIY